MNGVDESELIKRLTALEAANKATVEIESFYVVHDPAHIRIWCPRTQCPNLGRKLTVENQTYRKSEVSALDDDGNIIQFDEEEDGVVEQAVVIDKGPQRSQFPLGIVSAFRTEREAVLWCNNYYKTNQRLFEQMDSPPALEIVEVNLTA